MAAVLFFVVLSLVFCAAIFYLVSRWITERPMAGDDRHYHEREEIEIDNGALAVTRKDAKLFMHDKHWYALQRESDDGFRALAMGRVRPSQSTWLLSRLTNLEAAVPVYGLPTDDIIVHGVDEGTAVIGTLSGDYRVYELDIRDATAKLVLHHQRPGGALIEGRFLHTSVFPKWEIRELNGNVVVTGYLNERPLHSPINWVNYDTGHYLTVAHYRDSRQTPATDRMVFVRVCKTSLCPVYYSEPICIDSGCKSSQVATSIAEDGEDFLLSVTLNSDMFRVYRMSKDQIDTF